MVPNELALLRCPLCKAPFVSQGQSLLCPKGHCFDISSKGYINFATGKRGDGQYNKALFAQRRKLLVEGLFRPLEEKIAQIILQKHPQAEVLMDAGCGEGSSLQSILFHLQNSSYTGIGLDLAKDGVAMAGRSYKQVPLWLVGDISALPINSGMVDVLLNVLSPANYGEFRRVLKPDGLLIKVLPGKAYLQEMRQMFHEGKEYKEEDVSEHFAKHLDVLQQDEVRYTFTLNRELSQALVQMSPLSWHVEQEKLQCFTEREQQTITLEFKIIIGRNLHG